MKRRDFIGLSLGAITGLMCGYPDLIDKELELEEIKPGIYSWDKRIDRTQNATLLVHPYFIEPDKNPTYHVNLKHFLSTHKGPIITLEEHKKLRRTAEKFKERGKYTNCFFIPTQMASPMPQKMDWQELSDFLRGFKVDPLELAGGYYSRYHERGYGCLGSAELELNILGIQTRLIEGLTFDRS